MELKLYERLVYILHVNMIIYKRQNTFLRPPLQFLLLNGMAILYYCIIEEDSIFSI
jgi:hypothetical protein